MLEPKIARIFAGWNSHVRHVVFSDATNPSLRRTSDSAFLNHIEKSWIGRTTGVRMRNEFLPRSLRSLRLCG